MMAEAQPFGYFVEHVQAEPAFLRPPSYIPLGNNYKVTPLYAHPNPTPSAIEGKVAVSDVSIEWEAFLDSHPNPATVNDPLCRRVLDALKEIHRREQQAAEASKGWLLNIRRFVEDKGPRDEVLRRLDLAIRSTEVGKGAQ